MHRPSVGRSLDVWPARALVLLVGLAAVGMWSPPAAGQTITIIDEHPRLVFRVSGTDGFRDFQDVRDLYTGNATFRNEVQGWATGSSYSGDPIHEAARYVILNDTAHADNALNAMNSGSLGYSGSEDAETAAQWALAYDWIYSAWGATPPPAQAAKLTGIEGKLASWVGNALSDLDSSSPSLWHGRAELGAVAWVAALALPAGNTTYDSYRTRAWNHWQQALKATHASGGWPEGPTYWINNRAITFPLAYQSFESAVSGSPALAVADPLEDLRTLGLWQAYTERGDGSFERYGDVSSAVRISNGTPARSMDYYALVTQDPALGAANTATRPTTVLTAGTTCWATTRQSPSRRATTRPTRPPA